MRFINNITKQVESCQVLSQGHKEAFVMDDLQRQIAELPKVELHLHLEGAVRLQTLRELALRSDPSSPVGDPAWAQSAFHYTDLSHFVSTARSIWNAWFRGPEDYERIACELFVDLADQNIRYAEVSFSASQRAIPFEEMLAAINAARRRIVSERPIRVGLIAGLGRERGADVAAAFARKAADARHCGVVGIDLHGDEATAPPEAFVEAFDIARSAGLGLRAHAGEGAGASSVWGAIRSLGISRIAHGVRAVEDPDLLVYLRDHPITLDVCPTSNVKLRVVPALSAHPIRRLFDLGIRVTVNSDDPLYFDTTISEEYRILTRHLGFTCDELKRITLNAVEGAFLSDEDRVALRREIERGFAPRFVTRNSQS